MLRAKRLRKTGVWYRTAWWRAEPAYLQQKYCSRHEADAAFAELVDVFTAKWARSANGINHPLRVMNLVGGEWPFVIFLSIGRALREVRRHGVMGQLPERLRKPGEFPGASWELQFQAELLLGGCRVKPWPYYKGRRRRDFEWICRFAGQDVNVEVKHLEWDTVVGGVPDGTILDLSILFPPIREYPLRSVAKKLRDIEGRGPNIVVVFVPVPDDDLGRLLIRFFERNAERFERLSGAFLLNVTTGSDGPILRGLYVRNQRARAKHLSQEFVDLILGTFQRKSPR